MKHFKKIIFIILALGTYSCIVGQVKVGDNPTTILPGSVLEIESTDKALTLPRVSTAQMLSIPSPVYGMVVYNMDSSCIVQYRASAGWQSLCVSSDPTIGQGSMAQDGKSAFEIAVDGGYTGTETQWLASLQGPTGPAGNDAPADGDAWAVTGEDTVSNISRIGAVTVGQKTVTGAIRLRSGDANNKGFLAIVNPDGTRQGVIGWESGNYINYFAEQGGTHFFNSNLGVNITAKERLHLNDGSLYITRPKKDAFIIQAGENGVAYGNRSNDVGIIWKIDSNALDPGNIARISAGNTSLTNSVQNRYLGVSGRRQCLVYRHQTALPDIGQYRSSGHQYRSSYR